ncbi:hypothetical protein Zmor_003023 [Zophobas morio]|uniref:Vitellogenin n=2 Tax=Zophobas morio TaxID=2755281 RepID=A0AA38HLV6_9CUCU|nr:hypothetical protein Zmor_003023 [Zophobas morio]
MRSQTLLCLLVAFASVYGHPGWKRDQHYVYQVRGRSLASLNQISNDYTGVVFKAQLNVQPSGYEKIAAHLTNAQYAQVDTKLSEGLETDIPDSELTFQKLPLSEKPFHIFYRNSAIRNIIVSNSIKNWEANMIKSIVSQFQLDTRATNVIRSSINMLSQDYSNSAVYKTMEETVTGTCETLYEIHPYPQHVLPSKPYVAPHKRLNEAVIEIVKDKNFTHCDQTFSYHAGFEGISGYQPGNEVGEFLSRSSVTQAVITGTLQKYTIQSSVTVEEIALNPSLGDNVKGIVHTKLNVTLDSMGQLRSEGHFTVDNPIEVGVVYAYNNPYSSDNSPRPVREYEHERAPDSAESEGSPYMTSPRPEGIWDPEDRQKQDYQEKPKLDEAPPSPLLPYTVGYDGQSIKKTQNIVDLVQRLVQEIGQEFPHPKEVLQQHTPGKFVALTSLLRTMNSQEMQQASTQILQGSGTSPAKAAFSDAVAQSGTGPAIMTIKTMILQNKVSDLQAAQMIATTTSNARQPTEDYVKYVFEMVQNKNIMSRPYLNESLLLSFTTLARQVYVNKDESQGKYPVYSYGSFRTSRGKAYIKNRVIPYFSRKMNEAIRDGDSPNVPVYIRALGNMGQQEILEVFAPYLEGQRKASHFQRVLMVAALDQLVKSKPRVARSVLYKIYQNPAEVEQVRVAAVFQLMHTKPSVAMLENMASHTNRDPNHYVNAAVQSAILSACDLEAPEHKEIRAAAEAAKPLLVPKQYGTQYSQIYLSSYAVKEAQLTYQQGLQTFVGEDYAIPMGVKYTLQQKLGGVTSNILNAQAIVSSVEDLVNVFQQQTKEYQYQKQEKQGQHAVNIPGSSEYVAKALGLQYEQREQLEGNLYLQMGTLQSIFSFDNHTVENLPRIVQILEQELKRGKRYQQRKMLNMREASLAFPTALGLPFIYTYDKPMLIKVEYEVKVTAQPPISTGQNLQQPDTVKAEFDINAVVSGAIQTQLGIFTPFNHKRYSAGYNKHYQVVTPLTGKIDLNIQRQQLKVELQNPGSEEDVRLAYFDTLPYTSKHSIDDHKPNMKIIRSPHPYKFNTVVGDKSTGVAVYIHATSDKIIDPTLLYERVKQQGLVAPMLKPYGDGIQYGYLEIGISGEKSTTEQIVLHMGYQMDYQQNSPAQNDPEPAQQVNAIPAFADDDVKRQKEFIDRVGRYINSPQVFVADAAVEFVGDSKTKYSLTAGLAKSNVDPRSRFIAYVRQYNRREPEPQTVAYVRADATIPNTNGLNMDYAMNMDTTSKVLVQALLQQHHHEVSRVHAHIKFSKSQERLRYLKEQDEYIECQKQMKQGDTQLPTCAKMTARANLLDKYSVKMTYLDIDPMIANATYKAYSVLRHYLYPRVQEDVIDPYPTDHLTINGQFSPSLETVNGSLESGYGKAQAKDVPVSQMAREFLVPHPVFHSRTRLYAQSLKIDTYRPICVVDKTHTSTFDNKTYPVRLSHDYTVILQYVPRRPSPNPQNPDQSVLEQLDEATESYIVSARAADERSLEKEIQMALQMPSTKGKVVKIALKPSLRGGPKVYVNDQEVRYDKRSSSDFYGGHIQIYALPNEEVKVEVYQAFYVIFNGKTLKLTAVNSKFRDSARGLCGTFTGEPETDFLAPDNCILQDPQDFVQSYTTGSKSKPRAECYQKKIVHARYISSKDAGRSSRDYSKGDEQSSDCTGFISKYQMSGSDICFTIRPLPYCKPECQPQGTTVTKVDVHCMKPDNSNAIWRTKLDKGIGHDFTSMETTKQLEMEQPLECVRRT